MKVYFSPPVQRSAASLEGHERAHTGSGWPDLVIVRSFCGLTVVRSVAVARTPVFLMLAVAVAVLMMVVPAGATTVPRTVITTVPPGLRLRTLQRTSGAATAQPLPLPRVPLVITWVATMLDASRPCVPSTTTRSSARVVAVLVTRTL